MSKIEEIKIKIDLIKMKNDILYLRNKDGGYDWSFLSEQDREALNQSEKEINEILNSLQQGGKGTDEDL